jgi:glycosyltransferase involved in cell wall biosynthesis
LPKPSAERPDGAFSVVTISKDNPDGLAHTLASIARQTLPPRDVVLVRTGRSRETALDPALAGRVVEVADPGQGISAAFNAAIGACSGKWLVFLNGGDAFSRPDSLETLAAECRSQASADIVACRAVTNAGTMIPSRPPRDFCDFLYPSHQASAFRRTLFAEIGPYSPAFRVRMDLDWMARYLLRRGHRRIAFADRVIVNYQLDGISSTNLGNFHAEELHVLGRSWRFLPALLGFALYRVPARLAIETWRMLAGTKYLLRRFWRKHVHRRRIHPSLVTPPSPGSRDFLQRFQENLAACDWQPHPAYSVFTQFDAPHYTSLKDEYLRKYRCFWAVARTIRPRRLIELGTHAGASADAYLSASPQSEYTGVDQFPEGIRHQVTGAPWEPYALANALLGSRGFSYRLIKANLRELRELPAEAELVVVDAAHDTQNEYADLRLALSANPQWIFVDDAADWKNAGAAIARFLEHDLKDRLDYTVPIDYIEGGLVIRLKAQAK